MSSKYKNYRVLDDMILVEVDLEERVTKSGIIISGNEIDRREVGKESGIIRAMGEYAFKEMQGEPPSIGDRVLFKRYSGVEVNKKLDGNSWYRVMNDRDVFLIIDKEDQ